MAMRVLVVLVLVLGGLIGGSLPATGAVTRKAGSADTDSTFAGTIAGPTSWR